MVLKISRWIVNLWLSYIKFTSKKITLTRCLNSSLFICRYDVPNHRYRGYGIFLKNGDVLHTSCKKYDCGKLDVCLVLGEANAALEKMARDLSKIPLCADILQRYPLNFKAKVLHCSTVTTHNTLVVLISLQGSRLYNNYDL